jgi:HAD superfamily hydrolase (TIGR01509 family)
MLEGSISSVLSASKLGVHKSQPSSYEKILSILSLNPDEVVYIDDQQINLDVAKQIGINTILYIDNQTTIGNIKELL